MKRTFILTIKAGLDEIRTEEIQAQIEEMLFDAYAITEGVKLEDDDL